MAQFWNVLDRWKIVEWVILITAVIAIECVRGLAETISVVIAAILLVAIYNWWRRKGVFRRRT